MGVDLWEDENDEATHSGRDETSSASLEADASR